MGKPDASILKPETAQALLDIISPGSRPVDIHLAPGSYSNDTHILAARAGNGVEFILVVRRYRVFGSYDLGQKARREYAALQWACRNGIPAPQPLYLDETGNILGTPGIVTRYVLGEQIEAPADPVAWGRALAQMLVGIHTSACDPATRGILLDANKEATWFLRSGNVPDFMRVHPDGERLWQIMDENYARLQPVPATVVHLDYWPGNILWQNGKISAVVDWEEASFGDPAIDVAYCCMDIFLRGLPQVADEFMTAYEAATGQPLANLGFWELAAAARPMFAPQGWVDQSPQRERFSQFIHQAETRLHGQRLQA